MFKSLAVFAARVTPQFIKNTVHRSRLLDRISRLVFSTLVAADGTTAVINSGPSQGIKLAVGPHTSHAHLSGTYEIECQTAIARNVRPSTVCYDLGASIGYMSLLMARTAKHVYAFEPAPSCSHSALVGASFSTNQYIWSCCTASVNWLKSTGLRT